MKKVRGALSVLWCLLLLASPTASVSAASDVFEQACEDASEATICEDNTGQTQTSEDNSFYGPDGLLTRAARLMAMIVGMASIVLIIIGGFKYVIAAGDPSKISSARDTIIYAVVGITLTLATQSIVIFVLNRL